MGLDSIKDFNERTIRGDRINEAQKSFLDKICSRNSIFVLALLGGMTVFPSQTKPEEAVEENGRETLQLPLCSELNQGPILGVIPQGLRPAELCFPVFDLQRQTNEKLRDSIST